MKKILSLFGILHLIFACTEKEDMDYRDDYIGNYRFEIDYNYPVYIWVDSLQRNLLYWHDTTYYYSGFVKKSTTSKNRLRIHWGNDTLCYINNVVFTQTNEIVVDSNGLLSYPEYFGGGHTYFYPPAFITNDSVVFNFGRGGLGAWVTWNVKGVKK